MVNVISIKRIVHKAEALSSRWEGPLFLDRSNAEDYLNKVALYLEQQLKSAREIHERENVIVQTWGLPDNEIKALLVFEETELPEEEGNPLLGTMRADLETIYRLRDELEEL